MKGTAGFPHFLTDKFPLTFPVFFFHFQYFFSISFNQFNKYKNLFYKYISIKISKKIKIKTRIPHFPNLLCKISRRFPYVQNSLTFPSLENVLSFFSFSSIFSAFHLLNLTNTKTYFINTFQLKNPSLFQYFG